MDGSAPQVLRLGACTVDLARRTVTRDGTSVRLTAREAELLAYLAARPGRTVGRDELLQQVWGYAPTVTSRAADATAARLRAKVEVDTDAPVYLQTVHGEGYRFVPPRTRAPDVPTERSAFFGRTAELAQLTAWLDAGARLITLTGPPGTGKTRLARRLLDAWTAPSGGAWFCDLSRVVDRAGALRVVAQRLDLDLGALDDRGAAERLTGALAARGPALWVLDNAEQIVDDVAALVDGWLDAAPGARFVVTSRERLGVEGERRLVVPPLDAASARALFTDRAHAADADVVDAIVERLDRLPLAIELAAARVGLLTPEALLARLDGPLPVLRSRRRDRDPRQTTMRRALDGSWGLLTDAERAALLACASFRGTFTVDAAEALVGPDALDLLQALHDKSLLRTADDGRLGLLRTIAAYVGEHVASLSGTVTKAFADRHAAWFADRLDSTVSLHAGELDDCLAASAHAAGTGNGDVAARALLAADVLLQRHGSRRTVISRAPAVLDAGPGAGLRARIWLACGEAHQLAGELGAARSAYDRALDLADGVFDPALRGAILTGLGHLLHRTGDLDGAVSRLSVAVTLLEDAGRHDLEGWARARLGVARMRRGERAAASDEQRRALELATRCGDDSLEAFALANRTALALRSGDLKAARREGEAALACAEAAGDHRMAAIAAGNLGTIAVQAGAHDAADEHYAVALALHRSAGNRPGACSVLANRGDLAITRGRPDDARRYLEEALATARAIGAWRQEGLARINLGLLADAPSAAAAHHDAAMRIFEEVGEDRLAAIARSHRGEARVDAGDAEGMDDLVAAERALAPSGDRLQATLAVVRRGVAAVRLGRVADAHAAHADAVATAEHLGLPPGSELGRALAGLAALLSA